MNEINFVFLLKMDVFVVLIVVYNIFWKRMWLP
jgi:hypothetical protein